MNVTKNQVKTPERDDDPYHVFRRRVQKDALLAENPPRVLGAAIALVAILLALFIGSLRWVEYQETVPVNLTLKSVDQARPLCGEAYLQAHEMAGVQTNQVVQLASLAPTAGAPGHSEATVSEIRPVDENSLYVIRVELPAELATGSAGGSAFHEGMQIQGRIVTREHNLFEKLFSFFRTLAHSI
jgi:hypothetical protein